MNTLVKFAATSLLALLLAACNGDDSNSNAIDEPDFQSIVDVASQAGTFTTLVAALEATGLDETLDDTDTTFTVFAPTDAAFDILGSAAVDALLADTELLSDILLYHVVSGAEIDSSQAIDAAGTTLEMANGQSIGISLLGDDLLVNVSLVSVVDIEADNGVIHVIDAVLVPPVDTGSPTQNIVETAVSSGSFTTLVAALQATGLDTTLADDSTTFTVFAPTDDAFEQLGEDNVTALLSDTDTLTELLLQHVVSGAAVDAVTAYTLNGSSALTASGAEIPVLIDGDELRFGGAEIEITDLYTTNGIIHVIDTVVVAEVELPRTDSNIAEVAVAAGSFTTLVAALQATGLDSVIADESTTFTVFAPTDEAFAAAGLSAANINDLDMDVLSDILLYHVVSGAEVLVDAANSIANSRSNIVSMANADSAALTSGDGDELYINAATVDAPNVLASNGVIHVIDRVLSPPVDVGEPTLNIVETAVAAGNFTTLVAALQAAGLDGALADTSSTFTVFAPTDGAFSTIDAAVLESLIADTQTLTDVLELHVISGAAVDSITAFSLNGTEVETLGGDEITIDISDGSLEVGGAVISSFDIYTANGVIHVIDSVITGDIELPAP